MVLAKHLTASIRQLKGIAKYHSMRVQVKKEHQCKKWAEASLVEILDMEVSIQLIKSQAF